MLGMGAFGLVRPAQAVSAADCSLPYTHVYAIQGSGATAAITGRVTTQGVVVGDYEGASPALRGFYLQDATGDGDPATSDAIFVFSANNDRVNLGDVVRVTGTAAEFQDQTQISLTSITHCGTGSVPPVDVTLPFSSADYLERFEGMLVRLPQTLYVTEHYQLGRFGQVVMSSERRLQQPTNVVAPGAPASALQAANNLNRIILDDPFNNQNPDPILFGRAGGALSASNTLRGGDTATGIVGIMTYTWAGNAASPNAYRVRPINALGGGVPRFQPANPRPASPPDVGGTLRVASLNLLNFFNTFDGLPDAVDNCAYGVGGAAADCRGADTEAEFKRQWPKTVAAILAIDPDVLGVNEIENDGYGPDSAIAFLVSQLNAATAPETYAFVDVDAATGQVNALGADAIKVGLIYQPATVTPVGQTAALNAVAFVNGGDGAPRNRPSLAQAFEQNANGARFIIDINHLKSKGSACDAPDAGDGQGNCNVVRVNAAAELVAWLAGDPTGTGETDILLAGDFNAYAMEDPITVIKRAGYTSLVASLLGPDAYTYVFDGQWGTLDNALGSASLVSQVAGIGEYHINADEPAVLDYNTDYKSANLQAVLYAPDQFRVSDHDPILVGLNLAAPTTADASAANTVSEGAANTIGEGMANTVGEGDPTASAAVSIGSNDAALAPQAADHIAQNAIQARRAVRAALADLPAARNLTAAWQTLKAKLCLEVSLAPWLWAGETRLTRHGAWVFEADRQAVRALMALGHPAPAVTDAMRALVEADRGLAQTAIDDALAARGDPTEIAAAQEKMRQAQAQQAAGAYGEAIEGCKQAWHHAQAAMK
jgi:hypothetical protein